MHFWFVAIPSFSDTNYSSEVLKNLMLLCDYLVVAVAPGMWGRPFFKGPSHTENELLKGLLKNGSHTEKEPM